MPLHFVSNFCNFCKFSLISIKKRIKWKAKQQNSKTKEKTFAYAPTLNCINPCKFFEGFLLKLNPGVKMRFCC